ncbi:hypothetical protein [Bernardetia sp.]|uniref:hypothetical protein n=1 Tax=Bernardetia sp. TaxID=1937974 RepID=UPI0025C25F64|nr:hypothetical protein [Bernardetia sp.]
MGFRLYPIFIKCQNTLYSDKDILNIIGKGSLKKSKTVTFYQTSKPKENIFIGTEGTTKIIVNRDLAFSAFEDENIFLQLKDCEVVSMIWDETGNISGFSLIENGRLMRKILACDGDIREDFGNPIQEELEIDEENILPKEEVTEIIESEGVEGFKKILKEVVIDNVVNNLAKRYVGERLLNLSRREKIEMNKYE